MSFNLSKPRGLSPVQVDKPRNDFFTTLISADLAQFKICLNFIFGNSKVFEMYSYFESLF